MELEIGIGAETGALASIFQRGMLYGRKMSRRRGLAASETASTLAAALPFVRLAEFERSGAGCGYHIPHLL